MLVRWGGLAVKLSPVQSIIYLFIAFRFSIVYSFIIFFFFNDPIATGLYNLSFRGTCRAHPRRFHKKITRTVEFNKSTGHKPVVTFRRKCIAGYRPIDYYENRRYNKSPEKHDSSMCRRRRKFEFFRNFEANASHADGNKFRLLFSDRNSIVNWTFLGAGKKKFWAGRELLFDEKKNQCSRRGRTKTL